MAGEGPYISEDEAYGSLLSNVINPPDEPKAQEATNTPSAAAPQPQPQQQSSQPPPPRAQPDYSLRSDPNTPVNQPPAAQASSAPATPAPNTVTPSGNGPTATQPPWSSFTRRAITGSLDTADQARSAFTNAPAPPDTTALDTDIEKRSQPTNRGAVDPNTGKPMYKAGFGTNFMRAVLPGISDGHRPGAPNAAYQEAEQQRKGGLKSDQQQRTDMLARWKAANDANEAKAKGLVSVQPGYKDAGTMAIDQQKVDDKSDYNQQLETIKQQLADQKAIPTTEVGLRVAAATEKDPALRQQYQTALDGYVEQDTKRFRYAQRATGGGSDDARQSYIDAATANVQKLNDFQWDADANDGAGGFFDPANPKKVYSPSEFTDMKNQIATKLDKDLTAKKMRPLGVRFGVKATTPAGAQPAAQPGAPAAAAPAAQANQQPAAQTESKLSKTSTAKPEAPPKATTPAPDGAEGRIKGSDGNWYWFKGNKVLERSN